MSHLPPPPYEPAAAAGGYVPAKPDNYLAWAIVSLVLCCWPLSIPAVINAAKVDSLYMAGRYGEATEASAKAKKWTIISAATAATFVLLYLLFFAVMVVAGGAGY